MDTILGSLVATITIGFIYYRLSQWEEKFYEIKIFKQKNLNQFMADCYKLVYFLGFIIDVKCDMIFPFSLWESSDIWYNV